MIKIEDFEEKWVVDYEFYTSPQNLPVPICYCAYEINSGKAIKKWIEGGKDKKPEYSTTDNSLFIAFGASAEMGCHIVLDYPIPLYIVDLYSEFKNITNGRYTAHGHNIIGACFMYGIKDTDAILKKTMRTRIIAGPPYNDDEKEKIMDYCMKDVEMTIKLFDAMKKDIDFPRSLYRGRYIHAIAQMENYGIPIDMESLNILKLHWEKVKDKLIQKIDANYRVYEGQVFKMENFYNFLLNNNIPWQLTEKGHLRTDEEFMEDMAKAYPVLKDLVDLKHSLSQFKLNDLSIGSDGRNRVWLNPFGSRTGRNQPSSAGFIFGNSVWLRNLIKPQPGHSISYCDYEQQEIGIGAKLSGDENLIKAYRSGDPYISFAQMAGALPEGATKQTNPEIREQYKTCMLAVNYGMGERSLAVRANISETAARNLLQLHRGIFSDYWKWVESFADVGQLDGEVETVCGWKLNTRSMFTLTTDGKDVGKYRTLQNFPCQGNGAEILRTAVCLCMENDIKVIAPVHDAILIESTIENTENDVEIAKEAMEAASKYILEDFQLRVESKTVDYPNHYSDPRGETMWNTVWGIINEL
jgi:DNA polymerase I